MYTPIVRIIMIIFFVGMSITKSKYSINTINGFVGVLLIIFGYFRYGTVYLAFKKMAKGNTKKAIKLLDYIRFPNLLSKKQKAYFHYVKAYIADEKNLLNLSKKEFQLALNYGLRTENDISIAKLNIAKIDFELGNNEQAIKIVEELKEKKLSPILEKALIEIRKNINLQTSVRRKELAKKF